MNNLTMAYGTKKDINTYLFGAVIRVFHTQEDYLAGKSDDLFLKPDEVISLLNEDMIYFCDDCIAFHVKDNWEYEIDKELEAIERWLKERG